MSCGRVAAIIGAIFLLLPGLCFFALGLNHNGGGPAAIIVGLVCFALAGLLAYTAFKMPVSDWPPPEPPKGPASKEPEPPAE